MYDYLVVGAGLYGAVFARQATDAGKKVLVIDKRDHIAGNVYTEDLEGIHVHKYGAHIFHTNNTEVWNYVQRFATFNRFTNSPVANFRGELYSLPFNMYTFNKIWGVVTPEEAAAKIEEQRKEMEGREITNLELNNTTGKVDHPKQYTKIMEDGTKVKSVGKDISDSLGGAIYNAVLSVNINELDYLDTVTVTNNNGGILTMSGKENQADQYFNFGENPKQNLLYNNEEDISEEDIIDQSINNQVNINTEILNKIKKDNPNTKLSDQELLDLYSSFDSD